MPSNEDNERWTVAANVGRLIMREMLLAIEDTNELAVLMFIYARTHQFGNIEERIPLKHFIEGVYDEFDVCWTARLPMSRATVYRCLDKLEKKGMINRVGGNAHSAPAISINPEWTMASYLDDIDALVSHPSDTTVSPQRRYRLTCETNKEKDYKEKEINDCARAYTRETQAGVERNVNKGRNVMSRDAVSALRGLLDKTTENTRQKREDRKRKLNATALEKIWMDAFKKAYPTEKYFAFRTYEQSSFKKSVHKHIELSEVQEFIEWCVKNFDNVIASYFKGMKGPPRIASVSFVTKFIDKFWYAFEDARDPNRELKHRMAQDKASGFKVKPKPGNSQREEKLAEENKALKEKLRVVGQQEIDKQAAKGRKIKSLVKNRKTSDPEFGSWD